MKKWILLGAPKSTFYIQIDSFIADFQNAVSRASNLDDAILQNATAISPQYADLVSLAARQTFGGVEFSVSNGSDGKWNMSDVKIFMKDVGNSRCVVPGTCEITCADTIT